MLRQTPLSTCVLAAIALICGGVKYLTVGTNEVLAVEPIYPPLPEAVSSFGAIVHDGSLYVYGGHSGKAHSYSTATVSGKFHRLDLKNPKAWEELPSGPGLQGMNLAAVGGKIYRVGGMQPRNAPGELADTHSVAEVAVFDPASRKWSSSFPLPEPRSSHDAVAIGDRLYVVGGWWMKGKDQKPEWHKNALVLDLSAAKPAWKTIEQPFQRRALAAGAVDNKLFVFGGMNAEAALSKNTEIYDPATQKWSKGHSLPGDESNGFSPAACTQYGKLFLTAGDGGVYRYDAKAWEKVGGIDNGRIVGRLAPGPMGRLLILGGAGKKGNVAEIGIVDFQ